MPNKPKAKASPSAKQNGRGFLKISVPEEIKQKIIDRAADSESSVSAFCNPVIVALANGEIVSRVVDLRKK